MREEKREEGKIAPQVAHEDNDLLVVSKPSGWITNEADTTTNQPVLQTWVRQNYNFPIFEFEECRNGIVHRLDKLTSGVLIVAKTKESFEYLQGLFKARKIKKSYVALLHGELKDKEGIIDAPTGRLPWNRRRFGVLAGGRDSITEYKVREVYEKDGEKYSLVDFYPKTGRTHQIRIHAKHIGHPIVSDEFYAGRKTSRKDRKWCPRLFLHAQGIEFIHLNGKLEKYESLLPADLQNVLDLLEKLPQSK